MKSVLFNSAQLNSNAGEAQYRSERYGSALDKLLKSSMLCCADEGIRLNYLVNSADFGFMRLMDLCSLFNSAISQAAETVEIMEDPEKKLIDIVSERKGDLINIHICNYFSGDVIFQNGFPQIGRSERKTLAMRDMKQIAQKYGGGINAATAGDVFVLDIYLMRN